MKFFSLAKDKQYCETSANDIPLEKANTKSAVKVNRTSLLQKFQNIN